MILRNLDFVMSGQGFVATQGRRPNISDMAILRGPIDIEWDTKTGRICQIGSRLNITVQDDSQEWDGSGLFATPGLIDSHTHSLFEGTRADEAFQRSEGLSYSEISKRGGGIHRSMDAIEQSSKLDLLNHLASRLREMAKRGLTQVEIKSGYGNSAAAELRQLRALKELKASPERLPRIRTTYLGLHALPKGRLEAAFVDEMISVLETVQGEGLAEFVDAFPEKGFFTLEQSLRFISEAQGKGLKPKIHADEISDMDASSTFVQIGAVSIDHLQCISQRGLDQLIKSPTVGTLLPTTSFFLGIPYAPARKLLDSGARVALASDYNPGTSPELGLNLTMRLAALHYKMTPAEIFCAVTYCAAQALSDPSAGVLAPGHAADLCVWKRESIDPLTNWAHVVFDAPRPLQTWASGKELI
jgi:imidazolonepropionase